MVIKNVKFSYFNKKSQIGAYIDFIAELVVPSLNTDSIVNIIQESHPEYEQIRVIRFKYKKWIDRWNRLITIAVSYRIMAVSFFIDMNTWKEINSLLSLY